MDVGRDHPHHRQITGGVARSRYRERVNVEVEVRRSARRRRTVQAYRDGDRIVVLIPGRFSRAEESEWVAKMVARLDTADAAAQRRRRRGDAALARRAAELSAQYLDGRAEPVSVRWVPGMRTRWGSCTPAQGTIRLADALRDMPTWVQDYVLLHELAHLLIAAHNDRFWALVARYPKTERARGYLDGVTYGAHLSVESLDADLEPDLPSNDGADERPAIVANG